MSKRTNSESKNITREIIKPPENQDREKSGIRNILFPVFLAFIFLIVYAFIFDSKVDLIGDNASYFTLGKALATGHGYVNIAGINQNPENHFPPGYPVLISIVMTVFGQSILAIKVFNGIYILCALILLYFITISITGNKTLAMVSSILLAMNYHLLQYSTIMMSEAPFILSSVMALWLVIKIRDDKNIFFQPALYISLLCISLSYYIRSTGLALFGGIFLWFVFRKNWKAVIFYTLGFIMSALPWYFRSKKLGGNAYLQPLVMVNPYRPDLGNANMHDYITRIFSNISRYIAREIPSSTMPFIQVNYPSNISFSEWIIGLIMVGLIIYGLVRLRKFRVLIIAYLVATFGILFMWPEVWTGVRFILPVTPLLLICLLYGLNELYQLVITKMKIKTVIGPLIFLIFALFLIKPLQSLNKKATDPYPANWKNYFEIARLMKRQNINNAVVCCRKPDLFNLFSDTYTCSFPYTENDKEIIKYLSDSKVTHVVLDNLGYRQTYVYLLPAVQKNPEHFETIGHLLNPDTYLLKFKP
jgi:hypothetical protein